MRVCGHGRDPHGWILAREQQRRHGRQGRLVAPLGEQGSHQASALVRADYLGDIPEGCERLAVGDTVALIALPRATRRVER